jgi:hypothetical protein
MPHYAVVIADPARAQAKEIERNVDAHLRALGADRFPPEMRADLARRLEPRVRATVGPPKRAGDLHCFGERGCPDGRPWCEQCGDPAHLDTCRAAGHCEACVSLQHGAIAHPAVLAANGFALVDTPAPEAGEVWDGALGRFVKPE